MIIFTEKAYRDLHNIAEYTYQIWGAAQRDIYLHMINENLQKLSDMPEIGTKSDYLFDGCIKYPAGKHLIFYRMISDGIEIIRILHHSMDIDSYIE